MGTYPVTVGEISPTLDTLGGTPAIIFGTTASAGVATTFLRTDDRIKFPADLMSTANSATLALTDDGVNETLTGSLGGLTITPSNNLLTISSHVGAGGSAASASYVLLFSGNSSTDPTGTTVLSGIRGSYLWAAAATYTSLIHSGATVVATDGAAPTYTNATLRGVDVTPGANAQTLAGQTWLEITGGRFVVAAMTQSGAGTATVTDTFGLNTVMQTTLGTAGTMTNAVSAKLQLPNYGGTIRRGVWVNIATTNFGTEAAIVEGFYCDAVARGTTDRYSYRAIGHTTGTPTNAYGYHCASHGVGTNRWSVWGANKVHCDLSDFIANASGFGFSNRDSQSSSVGGGGTARYWRSYIDASATGVAGDCTFSIDSTGVLSISRAGASTGTVQHVLKDVGTAAVLT